MYFREMTEVISGIDGVVPPERILLARQTAGYIIHPMETLTWRDCITDAIRYWELRRILYNAVLFGIVLIYFLLTRPHNRLMLSANAALLLVLLGVLANVAYCAAYIADVFAQMSGYRDLWRSKRWLLFSIGLLFAAILTRFWALALFGA